MSATVKPAAKSWAPDNSIQNPPVNTIRVDRLAAPGEGIQKVVWDARVLDAYTVGVQAYVYGWPIVEAARIRANMLDPKFRHHAPMNAYRHEPGPADDKYSLFPTPNADLLYSEVFFDLTDEPMVIHVPDTQGIRFWTIQVTDFFTETMANISQRSVGNGPGDYALVGPNWKGTLPTGVVGVKVDQNIGFILQRLLFEDVADLKNRTRPVQQQFTITPLSAHLSGKKWEPEEIGADDPRRKMPLTEEELHTSLEFFRVLNQSLTEAGPRPGEEALLGIFQRIGVGPGLEFDAANLDAATKEALTRAVKDGWGLVQARSATSRLKIVNGWAVCLPDAPAGAWGYDTLQRAGITHRGIYSNTTAEYGICAGTMDTDGQPLSGDRKYHLHVRKEDFPKVMAYWGVTIYKLPSRLLFPNPVNRWMVNSIDKKVKYNDDGSMEIYIQKESPGEDKEYNWLPTPDGPFQLIFRMYRPTDPSIYTGDYAPPAIKRVG